MRKAMLALATTTVLVMGGIGCGHVDRARADYHRERADRAADHGHLIKAAREEHKANVAEHRAEHDPLP
jgi:hypothetical protein